MIRLEERTTVFDKSNAGIQHINMLASSFGDISSADRATSSNHSYQGDIQSRYVKLDFPTYDGEDDPLEWLFITEIFSFIIILLRHYAFSLYLRTCTPLEILDSVFVKRVFVYGLFRNLQFNFEGNYNLTKFIRMIGDNGMFATLRVGPFIEAEWSLGGFPFWLREVPNITFRTDNPPFKIENEYNAVEDALKESGTRYVQWAGTTAVGLKTGVPWVMCTKRMPRIQWYRVFGDPPSQRTAEDLAFSVARFFSKNGTLTNYYMVCSFKPISATSRHVLIQVDNVLFAEGTEMGTPPRLAFCLKLCKKALLLGTTSVEILGPYVEMSAQHSSRNYQKSEIANKNLQWEIYKDDVPNRDESLIKEKVPRELWSLTKDTTDYLWYTTSIELDRTDLPFRKGILPVLEVANLGH
ncbi:hypothetical protein LWI29_034764 [Acer saccharum]|uniref:beta-galactosidase n=1 Tax=Acer saccharum TaxID=4024 RepID=A0AA39W7K9_ACESA|nr:hypothetical protein LWI29_034764 [Acer saccharum]